MLKRLGFVAATLTFALVAGGGAAAAAPASTADRDAVRSGGDRTAITAVAHRGASAYAPENTLAAIEEADARGARTVEVDVQRTKDGHLVLMHDTTLTRTTNVTSVYPGRASYRVADFTLAEIRRLDAGSWFDRAYRRERVPTLQEGLDTLRRHRLNLMLELKSPELYPGIEAQVADTFRRNPRWLVPAAQGREPRLIIQSFNWESARISHDLLPDVPHGLLGVVPRDQIPAYADWADQINPSHTRIDAGYVDAVHAEGLQVFVYTVNEPAAMRTAIANGVDGIISDYPDVLLKVIAEETAARGAA
ncbi:glycerophosphodiester phosphodiesterase [Marinitenerispora sediminis]|uniref:Glycerophosphodiester phosphodiesterase n=1 Tax=Marinitenerispora sediminis TaxID=1931232 RepID=A0A368T6D1_9ACTN|nr:glycerophosphodiester phosphodiesterase family protein [Marinitenerispora sediminis]RCV52203.1 glycerophosphodiester phosphodiesterase [Marinitenerispora sediminis]RCV55613.1 glycerophosphodiester phosphodiesterase [Marinitenerispora sediminis]RCV59208.1 glycerophosphodiester phosphodiesterase [Marinitenerispora sediminis]